MNPKNYVIIAMVLFLLGLPTLCMARSDDSSKPINIKADSAEINDKSGVSVYRGNVQISQGTMRLTGNKVTLHIENRKLKTIIAEGNLSTFQQQNNEGHLVTAEAKTMTYKIADHYVELLTSAKLTQQGNTFASDRIVFHTDTAIVDAGNLNGDQPVTITIQPETTRDANE